MSYPFATPSLANLQPNRMESQTNTPKPNVPKPDLEEGLVVKSTGSWYWVKTAEGVVKRARLRGRMRQDDLKVTNPIAVGDRVTYSIEDAQEDTLMLHDVLPRRNYMARKSVHKTGHAHLLAANLDQVMVVGSLFLPRTSTGFIDRVLVSADSFGIDCTVVLNKADMLAGEDLEIAKWLVDIYSSLGYQALLTSTVSGEGLPELKQLMQGRTTLLAGHSGVGKSSLVNVLFPGMDLRTQEVSTFANKGKHTTTFAEMFTLEEGTYIIDSPGIKELGISDIEDRQLAHFFPEMRAMLGQCKYYNCQHLEEPGCAIIAAVEKGRISSTRYKSYLSMLAEDDIRTKR